MSKSVMHASLDYFDDLVASGVPENQAKVHIKLIEKNMNHFAEQHFATKDDIQNVKGDIQNLRHEMKGVEVKLGTEIHLVSRELQVLRTDIKRDMKELQNSVKRDVEGLKEEMQTFQSSIKQEIEVFRNSFISEVRVLDQVFKERFKSVYWMIGILASGLGALIGRDFFRDIF